MTGAWQSLSGVRLEGSALTRGVYMDESGTSKGQPHLVTAAVIIHADSQLGPTEDALRAVVERYVEPENRDSFVIHAADLYSANRKVLPPELHDQEKSRAMLMDVVKVPALAKLAICAGHVRKQQFVLNNRQARDPHELLVAQHAAAIAITTCAVERFMRHAAPKEVAWLFMENNNEVREAARQTQVLMKRADVATVLPELNQDYLPLKHIKDAVNFVRKEESFVLQLADACAWTFRRAFAAGTFNSDPYRLALDDPTVWYSMTTWDAARRLK